MRNSVTANIKSEGDVILKWTSRKELKLKNILYIPGIQKNLVSGWLLNNHGFCLAFKCKIFKLAKNKMVVGYYSEDQYAVSIKEDTAYPYLHSPKTTKETSCGPYSKKLQYACMTRSSSNKLFTPFKDPEREFRSSRRHFKTLSLDELRSLDFNLFSNQENSEEEEAETMVETMEQYMSKNRADYGSRVVRPKIEDNDNFELKGQFLKELQTNTFSGSDHEDANEQIEKVLEIVDLFHIPNITIDQVMLRAFPMSLIGAASRWLRNKPTGSIITWEDLKT
ncbi:hypothetical protein Tco_0922035 [Tanacetum coccineum]|uniref:Retrovirus-related Pol polyprotein from transposon TNT 1-94-like beta-barrel domain-containing protein n=1 Tax=Tanacetum coccineum TaxID=301880 RepID=A0ABQ5CWY5_9ASTR